MKSQPRKAAVIPVTDQPSTDPNRDPLTGEPGSHPVGVGVGAAIGGAGRAPWPVRLRGPSAPALAPLWGAWSAP